jgi:hypothetical protein
MSDDEPRFTKADGLDLYWLDGGAGLTGFLASPGAGLGPTVTLAQTWTDEAGLYLFLGGAVADTAAFQAALRSWLAGLPSSSATRMVWLANPAEPTAIWQARPLGIVGPAGQEVTRTRLDIDYGGMIAVIAGGARVGLATAASGWGFSFAAEPCARLFAPDGVLEADGGVALLTFAAGAVGCWRFPVRLEAGVPGSAPSGLEQLGAGIRFFAEEPADSTIRTLSLRPLIQAGATSIWATLDPLRPLDPSRTRLSFFPPAPQAEPEATPVFASGYATARGHAIDLTPLPESANTPEAGLVFAVQPLASGPVGEVPTALYLTPHGGFDITAHSSEAAEDEAVGDAPAARLLCGMAGIEYVGLPAATGYRLLFTAGGAAYAPPPVAEDESDEPSSPPEATDGLTLLGTTAWAWPAGPAAIHYYAQPEEAPFYQAGTAGFLDYLEIAAARLETRLAGSPGFPLAPYRGVPDEFVALARDLEGRAIAPTRRKAIRAITEAQWLDERSSLGVAETVGVTPQGLAIGLVDDDQPWLWLGIGNGGTSADGLPNLRFTRIDGPFRQAIQTNRLFMVLGDADTFMRSASVAYQLTRYSLTLIGDLPPSAGVPPSVLAQVSAAVAPNYPVYSDEAAFDAMLDQASPGITDEQKLVFQRYAGQLVATIADWRFQLSPRNWYNPKRTANQNAFLIFKFTGGRSVREMIADIPAWTWPDAASSAGPAAAQSAIRDIFRAADESDLEANAAGTGSPYGHFRAVIDDPNWTGVLALAVDVPLDALPSPLQALAAGIDPAGFYAHHLGLTATPFSSDSGTLVFQTTSSFGLIDYQNPIDQYFSSDIAFAFRVLQLTVGFENATLSSFTSRVELLINRLFGAVTRLYPSEHGNNILLDGVYQSQAQPDGTTEGTYVFAMRGENVFQLATGALRNVDLLTTQMVTVKPADPATGDSSVAVVFQMAGNLNFYEPPVFDPFSFGTPDDPQGAPTEPEASGLRFSNLAVSMGFSLGNPSQVTFGVADQNINFDLANSKPRPNSLVARFPVRLNGLVAIPDPAVTGLPPSTATPADRGFVSISAPIAQGVLGTPWYGLVYDIDLGSLGALAGSVGLSVRLLAGWCPAGKEHGEAVFVGIGLPGVKDMLGVDLPLQGVLSLGFRTIQFIATDDVEGRRNYLLRLRDFGIRVLGLAFPPGHNDVTLFGNPNQTSNTKLGWYAAYAKDDDKKAQKRVPPRSRYRTLARPARGAAPPERGS